MSPHPIKLDLSVRAIVRVVCEAMDVRVAEVLSGRRAARIVRARFAAAGLARDLTTRTLTEIGAVLLRDHSTLARALGCFDQLRANDADYAETVDACRTVLIAMHEAKVAQRIDTLDVVGLAARIRNDDRAAFAASLIEIRAMAEFIVEAAAHALETGVFETEILQELSNEH